MAKEYKIHAVYIISILVAVIIIQATVKWSTIPQLVDMIMFALSVTSLILAVLAIFYTIYSNSFITQNIGTLNTASTRISQAAEDLQNTVTPIPGALQSVESQMLETQTLLKAGFEKIPGSPINKDEKRSEVEIPESFFEVMPPAALHILYACVLAHERGVAIDLMRLGTYAKVPSVNLYWRGFLAALNAMNVLSYIQEGVQVIKVRALNPKINATESGALVGALRRIEVRDTSSFLNKDRLAEYFK